MESLQKRPELTALIENVSHEQGISNFTITNVETNQKGEGFMGEIFMVTIKDNDTGKHLDFIIKLAFTDVNIRQIVPITTAYQNEIYFYMDVYPAFQKFAKERGVTQSVEMVPRCLKVCTKEKEEMLVLENLKAVDFEIFDKKAVFDEAHLKLIFKTYGRLHAYSFALRDQQPEQYSRIVEGFASGYEEFMKHEMFVVHLEEMCKLAAKSLIPREDDEVIKKLEGYSGRNVGDIYGSIALAKSENPAIIHADCWSNNMLFRYEGEGSDRKLTEMRLIDWQLIKVGSPVCDLSYALYTGGSKKNFDNLVDYLQVYHASLSSFLRELGSDPDKLFPFSALKEHWRKYSKFGMITAFSILKTKLTDKEDILDLKDGVEMEELMTAMTTTKFREDDFNERIRGLLLHMAEWDAL